jgi:hypothetical protein
VGNVLAFNGCSIFKPQHGMMEYWKNGKLGLKTEKIFVQKR